ETVALRYFNVYGPRQSPSSAYAAVIPKFLDAANAGVAATVFGDGSQTRDFLYAADIAQANILASRADKAAGQTINIASGSPVSVLELHQRISRTCGVDIPPIFAAQRPGDIHSSVADTALARTALRFVPQIDMHTGLKRTDAWFKGRGQ
ncbi:MAG: NAD-dependent epimerase/dehydratase family protein, partial [Chthonomonadales bacterium]|nr:NAD-dependent epimerase/dehydratase family protein [Chthonomonadales bacterium]